MKTPGLGTMQLDQRIRDLLAGRQDQIEAFLEAVDALVEDLDDPQDEEVEEIGSAIERCYTDDPFVGRRLLGSTLSQLASADFPNAWMQVGIVRRLITMGLNPLGVAFAGQLELGGVTVVEGEHLGTVIECETSRVTDHGHEVPASFVREGLVWDALDNDITLIGRMLPQTMMAQCAGQPLEHILSSPLTTGMGLIIRDVEAREDIGATTIRLEEPRLVRLRDIPDLLLNPPTDWAQVGMQPV